MPNGKPALTLACIAGASPLSVDSPRSVSRLLAQLICRLAEVNSEWRVRAISRPHARMNGIACQEVGFSLADRTALRLWRVAGATRETGLWTRKAVARLAATCGEPDILICVGAHAAAAARRLLKRTRIILWMHGHPWCARDKDYGQATRMEKLLLAGLDAADALVVPSRAMFSILWETFQHKYLSPPVYIVPNWIDTSRFSPPPPDERRAIRARFGLEGDELAVAHIGGLSGRHKGIRVIEAALQELGCGGKLVLLTAGGKLRGRYRRSPSLDVVDLGLVDPDKVAGLYAASDLGVVPSVCFENHPLALLEMMSSGLCVVASRAGGIPEMVMYGENALLVEPNDLAQWKATLAAALRDPAWRRRIGANARRTVANNYDGRLAFEAWQQLIGELARLEDAAPVSLELPG